jgi:LPXTG-site transpeptidase (sortase) family protein
VRFWKLATWTLALAACAIAAAIAYVGFDVAFPPDDGRDSAAAAPAGATTATVGSLGPGSRLVIPSIGVDAGIVTVGVDGNGAMGTPDNGYDAGWFDFSAVPGEPDNAVMTGHVDYDIGPAVFWRLRELGPEDEVRVHLSDGNVESFRVTQVESYPAGSAPVDEIVGHTDVPTLTLITCDGWFDRSVGEYDHRLIVRAEAAS